MGEGLVPSLLGPQCCHLRAFGASTVLKSSLLPRTWMLSIWGLFLIPSPPSSSFLTESGLPHTPTFFRFIQNSTNYNTGFHLCVWCINPHKGTLRNTRWVSTQTKRMWKFCVTKACSPFIWKCINWSQHTLDSPQKISQSDMTIHIWLES